MEYNFKKPKSFKLEQWILYQTPHQKKIIDSLEEYCDNGDSLHYYEHIIYVREKLLEAGYSPEDIISEKGDLGELIKYFQKKLSNFLIPIDYLTPLYQLILWSNFPDHLKSDFETLKKFEDKLWYVEDFWQGYKHITDNVDLLNRYVKFENPQMTPECWYGDINLQSFFSKLYNYLCDLKEEDEKLKSEKYKKEQVQNAISDVITLASKIKKEEKSIKEAIEKNKIDEIKTKLFSADIEYCKARRQYDTEFETFALTEKTAFALFDAQIKQQESKKTRDLFFNVHMKSKPNTDIKEIAEKCGLITNLPPPEPKLSSDEINNLTSELIKQLHSEPEDDFVKEHFAKIKKDQELSRNAILGLGTNKNKDGIAPGAFFQRDPGSNKVSFGDVHGNEVFTSCMNKLLTFPGIFAEKARNANSLDELNQIRSEFIGKTGEMSNLMGQMKNMPSRTRSTFGSKVNDTKMMLDSEYNYLKRKFEVRPPLVLDGYAK